MRAPPRPPWLADLPGLYPPFQELAAPANCFWLNGQPYEPVTGDNMRGHVLGMRRRCGICGYRMRTGQPVFDLQAPGLGQTVTVRPGGLVTTGKLGPMHLSCALYSACRCPFLKYPVSKSKYQGREQVRGDASIVGYREMGIVFFDAPSGYGNARECGLQSATSRQSYKSWKELGPLYDSAITADAALVDMGEPRMYWTDAPADLEQLGALARADERMEKWAVRVPGAGLKFLAVP